MVWDFAEANPFSRSTGNWLAAVEQVARAVDGLPVSGAKGSATTGAAQDPGTYSTAGSVLTTDPPYYDNIGYAALSDFFYVWHRRTLRGIWPEVFRTLLTPKSEELIAEPARHAGGREAARDHFETGLERCFEAFRDSASGHSPIAVFYAFKQQEVASTDDGDAVSSTGWERFLVGILRSGLTIEGTWPIRTEQTGGLREHGRNSLASSIVLVCRRRRPEAPVATRSAFRRKLTQELPGALAKLRQSNIAPVDLAQASLGPGMAIFSQHAQVLETDGSPMSVRRALQLIHQVMDEVRGEEEGDLDLDTRFALTWFESFGFDVGPFGDAETLAKARSVSVAGVVDSGICSSGGGRVRLLTRDELESDWDPVSDERPTVWEATQHLIKRLESEGEEAAALLLGRIEASPGLGSVIDSARLLAYQLFTISERRGWSDEARAYNVLVVAWPELIRLAPKSTGMSPRQTEIF